MNNLPYCWFCYVCDDLCYLKESLKRVLVYDGARRSTIDTPIKGFVNS